ncbi:unnamed protein product [Ranitomeya imitator]|uniref:Reverse transcriptase domain-containing protein n=1 Tax=Ranitomeya imitator TaxID=111125 RepID=A0ABN9LYS2_9NEOB|nr:unnamed protein product [Ranitomeya imitator]
MANGKAPGVDGFPAEIYKNFGEVLIPKLRVLLEDSRSGGRLPASMREAIIVVIPKEGKDPTQPDSYRPISLLTTDVKLLAKVLAMRLTSVISGLVHSDQSGFMPDRSTAINLRRLYMNLQLRSDNCGQRVIASLDAHKAFDSVEWGYLWQVLRSMGFGLQFISWIRLMYSMPMARVRVNGELSRTIQLARGTRQGCPLSPLLFALAVEPLAAKLRRSDEVTGFKYGMIEERVALYADDILLFLADPGTSLEGAIGIIERFGSVSGLRINWSKSVLFKVDDDGGEPLEDGRLEIDEGYGSTLDHAVSLIRRLNSLAEHLSFTQDRERPDKRFTGQKPLQAWSQYANTWGAPPRIPPYDVGCHAREKTDETNPNTGKTCQFFNFQLNVYESESFVCEHPSQQMLNQNCNCSACPQVCREQFVSLHSQPILQNLSQFLIEKYCHNAQPHNPENLKMMNLFRDVPETGSVSGALTTESFLPPNDDITAESETPPTVPDEDNWASLK